MKSIPKKLLVIKNRNLGDAIIGLSSLSWLKSIWPQTHITYAIPAWIHPLFAKVNVDADRVVPLDLDTVGDYWRFWKWLRKEKYDVVMELHQSGRTKKFFRLFSMFSSGSYYFHNHHYGPKDGSFVLDQGVIKPAIQRDLDGVWSMVRDLSVDQPPAVPNYLDWEPRIGGRFNPEGDIILGVSATRMAKMWPPHYYLKLAENLVKKGLGSRILIPLSSTPQDLALRDYILEQEISEHIQFVEVPLSDLPERLSTGELYIGNDSGLKHLCVAMAMQTYTFFGPESPLEWHPYDKKVHHYFYLEDLACRTARNHYCDKNECAEHHCLQGITPEDVINHLSYSFDTEDENFELTSSDHE